MARADIDLTKIPLDVTWTKDGDSLAPAVFIALVLSAPLVGFLIIREPQSSLLPLLVLIPLSLVSALPFIAALLHKEEVRITRDSVFFCCQGIFGTRRWEKPMTEFRGVLLEQRQDSPQESHRVITEYYLTLYGDKKHSIGLLSSCRKKEMFGKWRAMAGAVGRPLLVKVKGKIREISEAEASGFEFR
jgi:hypothetical protein